MRRIVTAAVLSVPLAGCSLLPSWVQVGGDRSGWGNKTVDALEPPAMLIAVDGTTCPVTSARFNRTKPGDRVLCYWRPRGQAEPVVAPFAEPGIGAAGE